MNASEEEFAGKIKTYLDRSVADLAPGVAYRLREMRTLALDRLDGYDEVRQPALSAAGVHGLVSLGRGGRQLRPRLAALVVAVGVLVLGTSVMGYQQWHAYQQIKEYEELDAQILSSDLPIDAYLDTGFQAWLKTSTDD